MFSPADPSPELVELGEAETLGVEDEHHVRIRHIDADLDHRRGDEHVDLAMAEFTHHRVLLVAVHAPVDEPDAVVGEAFRPFRIGGGGGTGGELVGLLDQGINDVGLAARCQLLQHESRGLLRLCGETDPGDELAASRGQFVEDGDIEIAVEGEGKGARNRRRRHREHGDAFALRKERLALGHAELVLLIDHGEGEAVLEIGAAVEEGVGADDHVAGAVAATVALEKRQVTALVARAGEEAHLHAERFAPFAEVAEMLFCQDLGRGHEGGIGTLLHDEEDGRGGDERFSRADVALEETHHRRGQEKIPPDLVDGSRLRTGRNVGQVGEELIKESAGSRARRHVGLAELGATTQQLELEGGEFLEGEAAAGGLELRHACGKMQGADRRGAGQRSACAFRQPFGDGLIRHESEKAVDEGAERFLSHTRGERIDRHDAAHVRRGGGFIVLDDFEIGMIDEDAALALLRLAVDHEPVPHREDLREIGHVEPTQDETIAEEIAARGLDRGLKTTPALSASEEAAAIADEDVEADRLLHPALGKAIEARAILVTPRKMKERIADRDEAELLVALAVLLVEAQQAGLFERGVEGHGR